MPSVNYLDVGLIAEWTYKTEIHKSVSLSRICKRGRCKNWGAGRKEILLIQHNCLGTGLSATSYFLFIKDSKEDVFTEMYD